MMQYWDFLKNVLEHKRLVFLECRRLGLPLWLAIIHDWSKLLPDEFIPYADYFHGMAKFPKMADVPLGALAGVGIFPKTKDSVKEAFFHACELHYERNKHHWNHWVKDGIASPMPELYRREMLADWWAVARALHNESPLAWYAMMKREGRITLHPDTEAWVERELGMADKVWIAERDWGDGRIDFIGVFSHRIRAIVACEKTEADMPSPYPMALEFDKAEGIETWEVHLKHHYTYRVFETRIDENFPTV